MKSLSLGAVLALAGVSAGPVARAAPPVQVTRLVPAQPSLVAPDKVSILVFFDFKPASKALFKSLASWARNAGGNIVLDREPLVESGRGMAPLARAFIVARTLGVTASVLPALFKLAASRPKSGKQPGAGRPADAVSAPNPAIAAIFASAGINAIELNSAWNSKTTANGLLYARSMAARFGLTHAPRLIVNGLWKLEPGPGASAAETIAALDRQVNRARAQITADQ